VKHIKFILSWLTWPLIFAGQLIAFDRALCFNFDPSLTLLALTVANMTFIAFLELWLPDRPEWRWTTDRQSVNDVIHGVGNVFGDDLGRSALGILIATASGHFASQGNFGIWPTDLPMWGQVLLGVLVVDFCDYWKHRAFHAWSLAWPIHALHHNPDRMTVFKGIRLHFLEASIRALIVYGSLAILGAPPLVLLWMAALMTFLGSLNHSNVVQRLPRFVHALVVTQKSHWLHHSKDYADGACNFSPLTFWCDHLFGTFRHPLDEPLLEVGIEPDPIPKNVFAQLASPFLWPVLAWALRRQQRRSTP
jgi:sterol desaturase/sphingolipid hydroxylase (fatty acid hydroxylase superfamily)